MMYKKRDLTARHFFAKRIFINSNIHAREHWKDGGLKKKGEKPSVDFVVELRDTCDDVRNVWLLVSFSITSVLSKFHSV